METDPQAGAQRTGEEWLDAAGERQEPMGGGGVILCLRNANKGKPAFQLQWCLEGEKKHKTLNLTSSPFCKPNYIATAVYFFSTSSLIVSCEPFYFSACYYTLWIINTFLELQSD